MGTNSNSQQPGAYSGSSAAANPQIAALAKTATTPYQGNAPGGAAAQGVSQLAAALLARQKIQQWQQKNGIPTYNNPNQQPGQVTPGSMPTNGSGQMAVNPLTMQPNTPPPGQTTNFDQSPGVTTDFGGS